MNKQSNAFRPVTKAFALLGSFICSFFAVTQFIQSLLALPDIIAVLLGCAKAVLIALLAWGFWNAGKHSKNPFQINPFSRPR
ncbi:hypothetical protein MHM87_19580 [Alteromonas sp. Cnat3-28]|uniref:hypothetical protein n=1 Tax=Alteromonas sp. Cnat3-28 TaxID=2917729 RepID=UPI001EF50E78|nr:hypothetical protein [Alteromonas sp. Cnat3-28]MCG7647778.1 hypothetical protein [Alteromonas sp. Cnat3-28]